MLKKLALVLVLGLLCALPPTSSRRSKRSRGGGAARRGGSGSGSGEAEAGADEFLGIAERLVGRMGADAVAQAQLEQLLGAPIDGGAPAAALLSQGTSSAARQDHLQAARLFAAVPSAAGATDEELAAAALGMVAAGESLAALSHLRQALRLRQPAATATALQRGLARGLVAAALGSAVQRASPVVGAADGGPELVELLERSLRAAPPDFDFGNWVAHVYSEIMGQPESSAPVIGALTHTVLNREESRPWTIEHLNMGMMVHDELTWSAKQSRKSGAAEAVAQAEAAAVAVAEKLRTAPPELLGDAKASRDYLNPSLTKEERKRIPAPLPWLVGVGTSPLRRHESQQPGDARPLSLPDRPGAVLRTMSVEPPVFAIEGFADEAECAAIIRAGQLGMGDSTVGRFKPGSKAASTVRTNKAARDVYHHLYEPAVRRVLQRATAVVNASDAGVPSDFDLQVVHYDPQQHYTLHMDADLGRYSLAAGLERFSSMFLYLNDVEAGGETLFPEADNSTYRRGANCPGTSILDEHLPTSNACTQKEEGAMVEDCSAVGGLAVRPKAGTLMLWYNYHPDGTRNTRSIHAGCDVRSGEKWAANIWLNSQGGMSLLSRPEPPESAAPTLATLRAELRQMRLAALYKRAVQVGVSADDVDAAMDGDNARDSLTAMILEAAQA